VVPSRRSLLDLIEETYGSKHPDFEALRWAFERIVLQSEGRREKDAKLILVGLNAVEHTYEDWDELSDHQKESALRAVERVRDTTLPLLEKRGVDLH
jgi:hypothetical protein